jgi:hypothetical protein
MPRAPRITGHSALALTLASSACTPAPVSAILQPPVPQPPIVTAVCPRALELEPAAWMRELFPGCAPSPFVHTGVTCAGDDCPRPCGSIRRGASTAVAGLFEYDARGRTTVSQAQSDETDRLMVGNRPLPPPAGRDTYCAHDRCEHTGNRGGRDTVEIEARITRDRLGRVTELTWMGTEADQPAGTFEYAPDNRLVRETAPLPGRGRQIVFDYAYDTAGRIAAIHSSKPALRKGDEDERTYAYDAAGRLASITDFGDRPSTATTFEYDGRGRPTRISAETTEPPLDPKHSDTLYFYDCAAPHPYDEAIAHMLQFADEACGCASHDCKHDVELRYRAWRLSPGGNDTLVTYADGTPAQYRAFYDLYNKLRGCF